MSAAPILHVKDVRLAFQAFIHDAIKEAATKGAKGYRFKTFRRPDPEEADTMYDWTLEALSNEFTVTRHNEFICVSWDTEQ